MRDKILFFLFKLSEHPLINKLYYKYYQLGIKCVKTYIGSELSVKSLYLKGSFNEGYFVPVASDLDFVIVGIKNSLNEQKISKKFKRLNIIFPFISDYDFYTYDEMDYLRNFSGIKFFSTYRWKTLKGESIGFSYRFYPRKFYVDIIHEIYFQFIWLFRNLENREVGKNYISLCIQRQFDKVSDLVNYLGKHDRFTYSEKRFVYNKKWSEYTNEEIIVKINELVADNEIVSSVLKSFETEMKDINFEVVLKEQYYVDNFEIIKSEFVYDKKESYLFYNNFKLFYFLGCIDSYLIKDWADKTNDKVGALFFNALYFARLLEGRENTRHKSNYYKFNKTKAIEIKEILLSVFPDVLSIPTHCCIGKNVVITSFNPETDKGGNQYFKTTMINSKVDRELIFYNMYISNTNENFSSVRRIEHMLPTRFENIKISGNKNQQQIWQSEKLHKITINWCFGAQVIIASEPCVEISSNTFAKNIVEKISDSIDFVQCYREINSERSVTDIVSPQEITSDVFLWASKWESWCELGSISAQSWGRNINPLFYYQLTGELPVNTQADILNDGLDKIHKKKFSVSYVDELVTKKNSVEDPELKAIAQLFTRQISQKLFINEIGLFDTKSNNEPLYEYQYILDHYPGYSQEAKLMKLVEFKHQYDFVFNSNLSSYLLNKDSKKCVVISEEKDFLLTFDSNLTQMHFATSDSSHYEVEVEIDWDITPSYGLHNVMFEVIGEHPENIQLDILPKSLFAHSSDSKVILKDGQFIIPALLDGEQKLKSYCKLFISDYRTVSINLLSITRVENTKNNGFIEDIHWENKGDYIDITDICGVEYNLKIEHSQKEKSAYIVTAGTEIIWPVSYCAEEAQHYYYFKKNSTHAKFSNIQLRNINGTFNSLKKISFNRLDISVIKTINSLKVISSVDYLNINEMVTGNLRIDLDSECESGIWLLPVVLCGDFPLNDSRIFLKASPNGVSSFGSTYNHRIFNNIIYIAVNIAKNTEFINLDISYNLTWTRDIEVKCEKPIKQYIDATNFSFYRQYSFLTDFKRINLGYLPFGNYKIVIEYKEAVNVIYALEDEEGYNLWPSSYTEKSLTHEYLFSTFLPNRLIYLKDMNQNLNIQKVTLFSDTNKSLSKLYFTSHQEKDEFTISSSDRTEGISELVIIEDVEIPLSKELPQGYYQIELSIITTKETFIDELQLYLRNSIVRDENIHITYNHGSNKINFMFYANDCISTLNGLIKVKLRPFKGITIKIDLIKKLEYDDFQYEYFSKSLSPKLGRLYKGEYKVVLTFSEKVDGKFLLMQNGKVISYPVYTGANTVHCFFYSIQSELNDFIINMNDTCRKNLIQIDILKRYLK